VACDEGQGYFLSRPLDIDAFNGLLDVCASTPPC
jgi:EAL domain-containing protein (putative c-di-GMP-specific phosphodiesterase class I)